MFYATAMDRLALFAVALVLPSCADKNVCPPDREREPVRNICVCRAPLVEIERMCTLLDGSLADGGVTDSGEACSSEGETRPCLGGSDLGDCSGGSETCTAGIWSACVGRVDSIPEICDGLDNDCDTIPDGPAATAACPTVPNTDGRVCSGGECLITTCISGFENCNMEYADGCEAELAIDHENCGGCGNGCAPNQLCDARGCVAAPVHLWSDTYGETGDQRASALAVDSDGLLRIAGDFRGQINLGGITQSSGGGVAAFVARLTEDGAHSWSTSLGGSGNKLVRRVVIDPLGSTYIGGSFTGTTNLPGMIGRTAQMSDAMLWGHEPGGNDTWSLVGQGLQDASIEHVANDAAGNVYVVGTFAGSMSFGGLDSDSDGGLDIFVARASSGGSVDWVVSHGGLGDDTAGAVAIHDGRLFVAGTITGNVSVGGGTLNPGSGTGIYIAEYALDGSHINSTVHDTTVGALVSDISAGDFGVTITGIIRGPTQFDRTLPLYGEADVFVARTDLDGAVVWSTTFGGSGFDASLNLAVDADGGTNVVGFFEDAVSFTDHGTVSGSGEEDGFLVRLLSDGSTAWVFPVGGARFDAIADIAVDDRTVYVAGWFRETADFGGEALAVSAGSDDVFVAAYRVR